MITLTDTQKTNIVNYVRGLQSKKLKKAREVFRQGVDTLANLTKKNIMSN